jgi:hypothetical protein
MTIMVNVLVGADFYAVTVRDSTICRIQKFLGDSQLLREVELEDLSEDVQAAIIDKIQRRYYDE